MYHNLLNHCPVDEQCIRECDCIFTSVRVFQIPRNWSIKAREWERCKERREKQRGRNRGREKKTEKHIYGDTKDNPREGEIRSEPERVQGWGSGEGRKAGSLPGFVCASQGSGLSQGLGLQLPPCSPMLPEARRQPYNPFLISPR